MVLLRSLLLFSHQIQASGQSKSWCIQNELKYQIIVMHIFIGLWSQIS